MQLYLRQSPAILPKELSTVRRTIPWYSSIYNRHTPLTTPHYPPHQWPSVRKGSGLDLEPPMHWAPNFQVQDAFCSDIKTSSENKWSLQNNNNNNNNMLVLKVLSIIWRASHHNPHTLAFTSLPYLRQLWQFLKVEKNQTYLLSSSNTPYLPDTQVLSSL